MNGIVKITIKSSSGYCSADEAYNDKIILTKEFIEYEYIPLVVSEINPTRKWKYKTNSPLFQMKFEKVLEKITVVTESDINEFCTDVGVIEFNIKYSDNTKLNKTYFVTGDSFADLFKEIKSMVPECEFVPAVLLTEEDYEDE